MLLLFFQGRFASATCSQFGAFSWRTTLPPCASVVPLPGLSSVNKNRVGEGWWCFGFPDAEESLQRQPSPTHAMCHHPPGEGDGRKVLPSLCRPAPDTRATAGCADALYSPKARVRIKPQSNSRQRSLSTPASFQAKNYQPGGKDGEWTHLSPQVTTLGVSRGPIVGG